MKRNQKCMKWLSILAVLLLCIGCGRQTVQKENAEEKSETLLENAGESENQTEVPEEKGLEFPVLIDSSRLELISVFEYTGINSDDEDVFAEEIGAIQLKNVSGQCLKNANICLRLADGKQLNFFVEYIPADTEVLAFELESQMYDDTVAVMEAAAESEYFEMDFEKMFSYSVNGNEITVENISGERKEQVTVYYHCTLDGLSFGGKAYKLSLDSLEIDENKTVVDTLCYIGDVTVAAITAE